MKIIIYWDEKNTQELTNKVKLSLEDLWLSDFIKIENNFSEEFKTKMDIKKEPALVIEEETIDFCDVIFEWIIPPEDEIKAMLISIVWWDSSDMSCATDSCWTCSSASVCWV